jgi:hypothetical protein
MTFNFETKSFQLDEIEQGILLRLIHPTKFTTGQAVKLLAEVYTANFEQDITDALKELESEEA